MFFDDHRKAVTTILSKRGAKGGAKTLDNVPMKAEVVKNEDGTVDGRHVAAQDLIGAFHEKSADKVMSALSSFLDVHQNSGQGSGGDT